MAHGDALEGKWRGTWQMEWVASTLHTTLERGVSSITTADAHTSAASSRRNWRPRRFKWIRPFRRKTKSGFCACAITFQTQSAFRCATASSWKGSHAMHDYFYLSVDVIQNVLRLESVVNIPRKNNSLNSARLLLLIITIKLMLLRSVVIGVSEWTNFLWFNLGIMSGFFVSFNSDHLNPCIMRSNAPRWRKTQTANKMRNSVVWGAMPWNVPFMSSLKMEPAGISVNSYQTTRFYVPEDGMPRCVNIMAHKESIVHTRTF
jgi:hypothetical protein